MRSLFPFMACALCALLTVPSARGADPTSPQVVPIAENERVVHFVGHPFLNNPYYKPNLETFLVARFACRGLIYRRIPMGWMPMRTGVSLRMTETMLKDMGDLLLVHKPTLVILQPGNIELKVQYRSCPNYDFDTYPKALDRLVQSIRAQGIRVILCSTIPMGTSESPSKLVFPNDRLAGWVTAAQEISRRHGAYFVDQFTEAVSWKMALFNADQDAYAPEEQEKSWALFLKQIKFDPDGARVSIRADSREAKAEGATVNDVKGDGKTLSFLLQNSAGSGPVRLIVEALPAGSYSVMIGGKEAFLKTAEELAKGIDIGSALVSQVSSKEFLTELNAGYAATDALGDIQQFRLPDWVKLADFEAQKTAGLRKAEDQLSTHDAKLREMTAPAPLTIVVQPAKN